MQVLRHLGARRFKKISEKSGDGRAPSSGRRQRPERNVAAAETTFVVPPADVPVTVVSHYFASAVLQLARQSLKKCRGSCPRAITGTHANARLFTAACAQHLVILRIEMSE